MNDDMSSDSSSQIIGSHPNTYSFSKSLAENVVYNERMNIRVAIVGPSIVVGSLLDPEPGWYGSLQGLAGGMVLAGLGVAIIMDMNCTQSGDIIPADILCNNLIIIAKDRAQDKSMEVKVYNVVQDKQNICTWGEMFEHTYESCISTPSMQMVRPPSRPL